jgi:hypothetical protein
MADYFEASLAHLRAGAYGPQGLANTAVALALLEARPPPEWAAAFLAAARAALPRGGPRDTASTLWALAMLDVRPPAEWAGALLGAAAVPHYSVEQLASVLWALARLELQPGDAWVAAFHERLRGLSAAGVDAIGLGGTPAAHGPGHSSSGSGSGSTSGAHANGHAAAAAAASAGAPSAGGSPFSAAILEGLTAWAGAPGRLALGPPGSGGAAAGAAAAAAAPAESMQLTV